jgi:hypothetical protein
MPTLRLAEPEYGVAESFTIRALSRFSVSVAPPELAALEAEARTNAALWSAPVDPGIEAEASTAADRLARSIAKAMNATAYTAMAEYKLMIERSLRFTK